MLKSIHKLKSPAKNIQVSNNVPEKDNQLLLELEMDDEVKEIISFPEKYANTFLDVTVIKPKFNQQCSTEKKIMSGEQVKEFIAAMNLGKDAELASVIQEGDTKKSAGDYSRTSSKLKTSKNNPINVYNNTIGDHLRVPSHSSEGSNSEIEKERIQQVYTTPKTFTELSCLFKCKNKKKDEIEKPNSPCLCQNCAIIGVVTDSQKKTFATEPIRDPTELLSTKKNITEENNKKKRANYFREDGHQTCQTHFKLLSEKIRVLEERITIQEQKAVPKEYFKRIVSKLLNHISKVTGQIKVETNVPPAPNRKARHPSMNTVKCDHVPHQKFIVNPVTLHNEGLLPEKHQNDEDLSNAYNGLWKWGEDILKPGIDLKNKIISVMEDTLNNLKKSREKPKEEELKHFINEFSNNLYKTINEGVKSDKSHRLDLTATIDFNERSNKPRSKKQRVINIDEPISVTYVNSQILKWQDTQTTFKFESDKESIKDVVDKRRTQEIHKLEFIKTIRNTKEEDKMRLWMSIWNQASKNGHNKHNKVTVQIPDKGNPKNQTVEVEYTLGDLEYLLLGNKIGRR